MKYGKKLFRRWEGGGLVKIPVNIWCMLVWVLTQKCRNRLPLHKYILRKPIDSHWFKNLLLELVSILLCLFFYHKMMKFYRDFCSVWTSLTSVELFYSHRLTSYVSENYKRNIFDLLKYTSMDFFKLSRSTSEECKKSDAVISSRIGDQTHVGWTDIRLQKCGCASKGYGLKFSDVWVNFTKFYPKVGPGKRCMW